MSSEKIENVNGDDEQEMSGCPKFKQNAWKKELCSNCYRPKEEHKSKKKDRDPPAVITLKPAAQGILSLGSKNKRDKKKKKCVRFPKEESEVIGYGGLDASDSDDEDDFDFERNDQPAPLEREVAGEEEKALERLTKSNTDFNSSLKNLNGKGDPPKQQLSSSQPGKQQKQTIQVSIQPFSSTSTIAASRKSHLNKLLEDEDPKPAIINGSPKETVKNPVKEMDNCEVKERKEKPKAKPEPKSPEETMPNIKTIVIESKKEERGTPEGRKTHIQRGSIVTKAHEQAKNKLHLQSGQKSDKRPSDDKNEEAEDVKTIIITSLSVEEKNEKNLQESIKDEVDSKVQITSKSEEVTVKVLKLLNGQNGPAESREMAGEPDGKADSDEHEQETPITPPPRSSFLHREMTPAPDPKLLPKPPTYSSTTDLKSKPVYPTEVKSPPRPTSLLNLNSDVKTSKPVLNVAVLNGSSPVLNTLAPLSNGSPALNGSAPALNGEPPMLSGSSPVLNGHHEPKTVDSLVEKPKKTSLNGSTPEIKKTEDPSPEPKRSSVVSGISERKSSLESSPDTKKAFLLNGSCPDIPKSLSSSPEKPPKTLSGNVEVRVSKSQQPSSSPDGKSSKSIFGSDTKMSKASSMFNSLSSEFKSFKSFLSSPSESKLGKGAPSLPPTPLTLARSTSPPPALPAAPPPMSQSSSPSPSISTSSMSSKPPPSPCSSPPSSLDTSSSSIPPLPMTPPPQPAGAAPSLTLTGQTAPVPPMTPLQINTTSPHSPMTPADDVPVLQEVVRKRPAPKPPVADVPPEPLPRRRNSSEANSGHGTEKKKTRVRQTLRKLLRFGSREEELPKPDDEPPAVPRPRPQIIHPLDLNKSAVQVLPPHSVAERPSPDSISSGASVYSSRPSKPPPPPRSESLNLMERLRPRDSPPSSCSDNTYVNLGEGRCGITPVKPQRTGSMRDAPKAQQQHPVYQNEPKASSSPRKVMAYGDSEHVYECVGVTSDVEKPLRHKTLPQPPSPSSGSEEEIYYPYVTFQNGECKTVMKKRGVVTKSLEENYGAVVIANLEALAHLLRQVNEKRPEVPSEVQAATNLDWSSFDFPDSQPVALNCFSFVDGSIGGVDITLALSPSQMGLPTGLETWRRFSAVVPQPFGDGDDGDEKEISVLNRCKIERFVNFVKNLDKTVESVRDGVRLLLQILQHMTKEEMTSVDVSSFVVLSSAVPPVRHKACYLPPEEEESATCQDAAVTLTRLLLGDLPLGKVLSKCPLREMPRVLEVWLWGPTSVLPLQAIKRWLDLERANLLQSLVRSTPSDELDVNHLSFLVHTNASQIVSANEIIHNHSS